MTTALFSGSPLDRMFDEGKTLAVNEVNAETDASLLTPDYAQKVWSTYKLKPIELHRDQAQPKVDADGPRWHMTLTIPIDGDLKLLRRSVPDTYPSPDMTAVVYGSGSPRTLVTDHTFEPGTDKAVMLEWAKTWTDKVSRVAERQGKLVEASNNELLAVVQHAVRDRRAALDGLSGLDFDMGI